MSWTVASEHETKRIPIQKKDEYGDEITIRIKLERNYIILSHSNGSQVVFKRFLHRKKWHWHRNGKPKTHSDVIADLAAMLYEKDTRQAQLLVDRLAPNY